jgi:RNA polymerase sigma-70 factor, ECF subfamily
VSVWPVVVCRLFELQESYNSFIAARKLFSAIVNNRPPRTFIVMDDDPKEINVSPTVANTLFTSDLTDTAKSSTAQGGVEGSSELEGLAGLFRDHYKGIFRVAYRITGSQSDAEDVLQNVFLRLTPGGARRDFSPNPRAFLYRAAINASLDLLRSRKRANAVPLDVVDFDQSSTLSIPTPADDLADTELRDLVRQAVAKLEGRAAQAFVLRYYEGYDNSRIAEVLGTSQMVVAVTLHRARTRLRKEIGNYLEKHHEAQ